MSHYRRLLGYIRPHSAAMVGTIACSIGAAVLDAFSFALLVPFLNTLFGEAPLPNVGSGALTRVLQSTIGALLDPNDKMGSLQNVILIILVTIVLKNVLVWVAGQFNARLQEYVTRDLRDTVYRHLQRLPMQYFTRTKAGQILSRVLTDTGQTKQLITQLVTQTLQSSALVISYVIALLAISWRLTLPALFIAPVLLVLLQPLLKRLRTGYRRIGNQHGEMTSVVQEVIGGIRLVKSFGAEGYEQRRFLEASNRYSSAMVKVTRISYLAQPITEIVGTVMAVVLLWIGARQVLVTQTLQPAQLIVFLTFVMRLLQPLNRLSQIRPVAQQALAASDRLFELLDLPTEEQMDKGTRDVARFERSLEFDRVNFSYESESVLRDISFTARKGDMIAIVGPSGSGKSTLMDLIPRFYEPVSGRILLDGMETRDIKLAALRGLTGIVSQDTVLFHDTVRNNIAYGNVERFTADQIEAAARAANAHEFITRLPDGYDTVLGERGARLSGGQRQRIAIARALLVDPPILILDEATSALDTESERLVQQAIDRLLQGRTVFVIAHRLSTVEHADMILVLEDGRIVERGNHDELLKLRGAYHRLHSLQFRERPTANPSDPEAVLGTAI